MPAYQPTADQFRAFRDDPYDGPIAQVNLLKFRVKADYATDHELHGADIEDPRERVPVVVEEPRDRDLAHRRAMRLGDVADADSLRRWLTGEALAEVSVRLQASTGRSGVGPGQRPGTNLPIYHHLAWIHGFDVGRNFPVP